jgi:diadenylate cyclase
MYVRPSRDPRRPGPFPFPSSYPAELGGMSADRGQGYGIPARNGADRLGLPRHRDERLAPLMAQIAPGTVLRHGLERMMRGATGGLIVVGDSPELRGLMSGGFRIDVLLTAQRLSELAKMDGAIVLDAAIKTILWANVHLMPDRSIPTDESGTRHRTAERVARQTGLTVVAVSKSMRVVTLYADGERDVVPETTALHVRANQALQALERYRARLDEVVRLLNSLELSDQVTLRDVVQVLVRGEMLHRLAVELDRHVVELGTEGRLLRLQSEELLAGVSRERQLLARDYLLPADGGVVPGSDGIAPEQAVIEAMAALSPTELLEPTAVVGTLNRTLGPEELEVSVEPRGYRLLSKVPRLGWSTVERVVDRFGTLANILSASPDDLVDIEGIGAHHAKSLRDGMSRLGDADPGNRYV